MSHQEPITYLQAKHAARNINPQRFDEMEFHMRLPAILTLVGLYCFVNQIPEDDNTRILREAIKQMDRGEYLL